MVCPAKLEGADTLEVFALEKDPCTGKCIKLTARHHWGGVGNAMQNANGLFNQGKGGIRHVCGPHDLLRKARRAENGTGVTSLNAWRKKASRQEDLVLERETGFEPATLALAIRKVELTRRLERTLGSPLFSD
jgi:hypothetical protein